MVSRVSKSIEGSAGLRDVPSLRPGLDPCNGKQKTRRLQTLSDHVALQHFKPRRQGLVYESVHQCR
ncbi:hypothetical protein XHV734_1470 [Xanthomonas hortorum pv. vitians]|nr:hypothetical protein XHV734_1470 [Xanthomonas hortorum pv. vitians]